MVDDIQRLGKYRIVGELGRGGFATVYRAVDTTLEREVALKVLNPLLMQDEHWVRRFQREAENIAALSHPHIVKVYEVGESDGRLYMAMDLARGPSLGKAIARQGRIVWEDAMLLLNQIVEALEYAHKRGMVHRDLKPANILLDPRKGVLLADFGFARLVGQSSVSASISDGLIGTPAYIPPEIWEEKEPTPQTDIYALGCVVYEMLTGEVLFGGKTPVGMMKQHVLEGARLPQQWPEDAPAGLAQVLGKAVAQQPVDRYASAREFLEELEELASRPLLSPSSSSSHPIVQKSFLRWLALFAAVATVAAVVLVVKDAGRRSPESLPETALLDAGPKATPTASPTATITPSPSPTLEPTPSPTPKPTRLPISQQGVRPLDGMEVVRVPGGQFEMGSNEDEVDYALELCELYYQSCQRSHFTDEIPRHIVSVDTFWLDRTEVTNAQYRLCVDDGVCAPPSEPGSHTREDYFNNSAYDNLPVVYVSWEQAAAYCEWVGGRLPTEAEWEYAARGTSNHIFPWGDEFDEPWLNFCDVNCTASWADESMDDRFEDTAPVGSYPEGASWCGVDDLAGNVGEWVADWYGAYSSETQVNPTGRTEGEYRVYRNGSFLNHAAQLRAAYRNGAYPHIPAPFVGFRCAMNAGDDL